MSHCSRVDHPDRSIRFAWILVAMAMLGLVRPPTHAQAADSSEELKPDRVYQRDAAGQATISLIVDGKTLDALALQARIFNEAGQSLSGVTIAGGKIVGVPTGGPYTIVWKSGEGGETRSIKPVFVGDLWVLAGQSNMEGYGDLKDLAQPHPRVMLLGMDGAWTQAREPLHWLVDSPDPVHSGDPRTRAERSKQQRENRAKGSGLGLTFAATLAQGADVPIGLIACAHGGTSLAQWSPDLKNKGGDSLYGSMIRQVGLAGGKVKGVLWYQGESDAFNADSAKNYSSNLDRMIQAIRGDFGQTDLPFYHVQIGRFVSEQNVVDGWNQVRESQRLLPSRLKNTQVVSVMDLELDDPIHVGTHGLKRAGRRLAQVVAHDLYGKPNGTSPNLESVTKGTDNTLRARFKGVNTMTRSVSPDPYYFAGARFQVEVRERDSRPGGTNSTARVRERDGLGGEAKKVTLAEVRGSGRPPQETRLEGLHPPRHISGFSIRDKDGKEITRIYEAMVDPSALDTVVLKLSAAPPAGSRLWYGYGLDPYCNLTDALDMAVPAFGPVLLDDLK